MRLAGRNKKMALRDALAWYGIEIDNKKAHRALYDAEVTSELVIPVLSGEYKKQIEVFNANMVDSKRDEDVVNIGDLCGGILTQLLQCMNQENKYVV